MSDKEKNIPENEEVISKKEEAIDEIEEKSEEVAMEKEENEESFEDIFSSLREKYNLSPFGEDDKTENNESGDEIIFYNPSEDSEIDDFFKEREENYTTLYEEVDAKIAGVDDEVLKREEEIFNLHFEKDNKIQNKKLSEQPTVFEDVYSSDGDEEVSENTAAESAEDLAETKVIPVQNFEENEEEIQTVATNVPQAEIAEQIEPKEELAEETKSKKQKGSFFPHSGDSTGEKIRKIVFLISIIALVVSAGWLINDYFVQPYLISKQNQDIAKMIVDSEDVAPEEMIETLNNLKPEEKEVTFESLKNTNKDFKAWIIAPGADISLPVVQTTDNSKYLNTGFNGKWLSGGTAFIDSGNKSSFFGDRNTTIYGHNMRDGSMFGSIKNYKNVDTFKKNPFIYVYTEDENYVYKIYSVFLTSAVKSDDNGYVFNYNFRNLSTDENFVSYMEEVKMRSYYNTGVDYQAGDRILTLSTCDRTVMKNGRLVIVARLVRENEDLNIDESLVKTNSNQKFPAAYYDKKKQNNPYKNAIKWIAQ